MTAENTQQADQPIRSNWNVKRESSNPSDPVEKAMNGPSMFESHDDDYLEPGEMPEPTDDLDVVMDQYLDQMSTEINQGQLLSVPIVGIKSDHVLVDVGEKSEGMISIKEFPLVGDKLSVQVGDVVEAVVKGYDPESGLISLSYLEARRRKAMKLVHDAMESKQPITGTVTRTVKGGLIVDIGTTAFLPASQIDLRRIDNFDEWIGREVEGYIIEYVPEKRRIIVSRRKLLEEQREARRQEVMGKLNLGQMVEVIVKRIVEFGVFVDLDGVDGLIPRSEISWQRNAKPEDFMNVGDSMQAKIIEVDPHTAKVTLSRRQAHINPWDSAAERYPVGSSVGGTVVSLTSYGAFVRLEEGLDGMIHVSDMAWDTAGKKPSDYVTPGQEVTASVLSVDAVARRISLGLKQLTLDPWEAMETRYPRGTRIKGQVTGLTKYGAFVELEPGIEGMIHISDFSWEKRINQPRDVVKKGDEVEVCVLEVDRARRRISLGVKQLSESPFERFLMTHSAGDVVEGEVTNLTEFGAFIRLDEGVEGFMHVSQLERDRVNSPSDCLSVGQKITAKITKIETDSGKISLSRRQMLKEQERHTVSQYMRKKEGGSLLSMGELLGDIVLEDDLPAESAPLLKKEPPTVTSEAAEPQVASAPLEEAAAEPQVSSAPLEEAAAEPQVSSAPLEEAPPESSPAAEIDRPEADW